VIIIRRIGILTGGGDAPGLNAVIKGIVTILTKAGIEVYGLKDGWKGALDGQGRVLELSDVENIQGLGGTILGSSRTNIPKIENGFTMVEETMKRLNLEGLIAIGGDDTLGVAAELNRRGFNVIGVPKTIDNDLPLTDYTFGYDTAINIATEAIDRLHTTSLSHSKSMVVEVMGRTAGWIAMGAGLAGGADMILVPEFPKSIDEICDVVKKRRESGKPYTMIVVSEGFQLLGVEETRVDEVDAFGHIKLDDRKIAESIAEELKKRIGESCRTTVLGFIQRGGAPSAYDRNLGLKFGIKAAELARDNQFGYMVALRGTEIEKVELENISHKLKLVDEEYYKLAENLL